MIRTIGYELLGPVIHRWLLGLHQYINYFDDGDTAFLFCARAGQRIRRLYDLFLSGQPGNPAMPGEMFWISRVSVCKGTFVRNRRPAVGLIAHEYAHWPMSKLVEGLLRHHPDRLDRVNLDCEKLQVHGQEFPLWLTSRTSEARVVGTYLEECATAFESYIAELMVDKRRAVLIDSGWQGSAQSMLSGGFPEYDWQGVYFGRMLAPDHDPSIASKTIGIMFERNAYDPAMPESAFALHRHIIETLLEPNGRSIEEIPAGPFKCIANRLIDTNRNEHVDYEKDRLYRHVSSYLQDHAGLQLSQVFARHQAAMGELARIIVTPTRDEARALICKDRSADFGKDLAVPVLLSDNDDRCRNADDRIRHSLWPQGQIALEYEGGVAIDLQLRAAGVVDIVSYFDPKGTKTDTKRADQAEQPSEPVVAVITRTKNRRSCSSGLPRVSRGRPFRTLFGWS